MQINYEGTAVSAKGRLYPIKANSYGKFFVPAVPGADRDLVGDTPEEVRAGLDAWLEAAEGELEFQREQRRDYQAEKKAQAEEVVNKDAWLITEGVGFRYRRAETDQQFLESIKINRVKVRGRKQRSKKPEALITLAGKNTSRSVVDLKLGTAEDMEEFKALALASWKADKAAEEAKEPWAYHRFYGTGFGAPDPGFKERVNKAVATYNGDGTWTISAEGLKDFVVDQEGLRSADAEVERRMASIQHPYTMIDIGEKGYNSEPQKVVPLVVYKRLSAPNYVFPDLKTALTVVDAHNNAIAAAKAKNAWKTAHRYTYGWEEGS